MSKHVCTIKGWGSAGIFYFLNFFITSQSIDCGWVDVVVENLFWVPLVFTAQLQNPWTSELLQECFLCCDQSEQTLGQVSKPQILQLITIVACILVFSCMRFSLFPCKIVTFQEYFWWSWFCKSYKQLISNGNTVTSCDH